MTVKRKRNFFICPLSKEADLLSCFDDSNRWHYRLGDELRNKWIVRFRDLRYVILKNNHYHFTDLGNTVFQTILNGYSWSTYDNDISYEVTKIWFQLVIDQQSTGILNDVFIMLNQIKDPVLLADPEFKTIKLNLIFTKLGMTSQEDYAGQKIWIKDPIDLRFDRFELHKRIKISRKALNHIIDPARIDS